MAMELRQKRVRILLFLVGIILLSKIAEKCRELVGEEGSSQCGKFTIFDCFDMGAGSLGCSVKEAAKLFSYNVETARVLKARDEAVETALFQAASKGMSQKESSKLAEKHGKKAAKMASREAKRVIGPIMSSGWDFFEAIYYGATMTEGFLRSIGTLFGTYSGGFFGEQCLGRLGYLVGSQIGSWVGGRIGLMVYDVVNAVHFLSLKFYFQFPQHVKFIVSHRIVCPRLIFFYPTVHRFTPKLFNKCARFN